MRLHSQIKLCKKIVIFLFLQCHGGLIFLNMSIYQNIFLRKRHFYCRRLDTFCYKTQNELNMGNVITWNQISFCGDPLIHMGLE